MTENPSAKNNGRPSSTTFWLGIVLVVGFLTRLFIYLFYQPVTYSDTPSYRRLANAVLGGFTQYDGTRTPGYPVFLALTSSDRGAWIMQLVLGFATTLLLFYIGWKLTNKPWFGGLIGLSHTFNLGQLFFESNLLTESLTTFLMVLTMAGVLFWLLYPNKRSPWLALLIGITSTFTLLVRPLFIYLPFLLLIFMWLTSKPKWPRKQTRPEDLQAQDEPSHKGQFRWQHGIAFLLPVIFLAGGWITFIHSHFGDWSLTTMTGYHLIQHTGNFFEYVPDEYAALRDTYIKYRDLHISQFGTQTNSIWDAIPEMSQASGYNFYDLSRVLTRISIQLIMKHPFLFIKNAINGWWMFWRTSFYWSAEALRLPWLVGGMQIAVQIQRAIIFFINLLFIFTSVYFGILESMVALRIKPAWMATQKSNYTLHAYTWLLLGTVWIASILQTLLDHGDNPRFLVPLQSLVILWVTIFFFQLLFDKPTSGNVKPKTA